MSAIDAIFRTLQAGDHVVVGDDVYGGTFRLLNQVLPETGISATFADFSDLTAFEQTIQPSTKLIWLENANQPLLEGGRYCGHR